MRKTVQVRGAHRRPERAPIQVRAGEDVQVLRRDDEWPAFVLIQTARRGSGWVPSRYLSAAEGTARVIHDYDTTELDVDPGDMLTLLERDDESGWHWCEDAGGRRGWVPVRALTFVGE